MTWKEKAEEIAMSILDGMEVFDSESVKKALSEAAIKGMQFDSLNWCTKQK